MSNKQPEKLKMGRGDSILSSLIFLNQNGKKGMVKKRKTCPLHGAKEAF
jgi:hypothetical protein